MPNYVRFLKEILTKKRKQGEYETVAMTKACSSILTSKILAKMKDPRSFTIPISIGGQKIGLAFCDLGASINLMPLSINNKLGIGEARPTIVTLQLADRFITHLEGKFEDVLVQVDKFISPADFIILDYDVDKEVPIILGSDGNKEMMAKEDAITEIETPAPGEEYKNVELSHAPAQHAEASKSQPSGEMVDPPASCAMNQETKPYNLGG
ncbi:uncharacterized protein LOC111025212 [Momordica charantia]|uniref:Uncharacterized protein LOC111025212 n=1 Tax=Momordica charantia TaxID=3673 RepID=A0A6J1DWZ3_MOMCH|nr:uncharacterized protein LOC111025212 [Momordica charantia]